jgi:hypothetical protein
MKSESERHNNSGLPTKKADGLFPLLRQTNTLIMAEAGIVIIVLALLAPVLARFWKPVGPILLMPVIALGLFVLLTAGSNLLKRFFWARRFNLRISAKEAVKLLSHDPNRYVIHNKNYGRLDRSRLAPATLLEDKETKILIAVFPASQKVSMVGKQLGVQFETY